MEQPARRILSLSSEGAVALSIRSANVRARTSLRNFTVYLGDEDFPQQLANLSTILEHELASPGLEERVINMTYERPVSSAAPSPEKH